MRTEETYHSFEAPDGDIEITVEWEIEDCQTDTDRGVYKFTEAMPAWVSNDKTGGGFMYGAPNGEPWQLAANEAIFEGRISYN